jgi:hypothetical protein
MAYENTTKLTEEHLKGLYDLEPIFIFRGRDRHLPAILFGYLNMCGNSMSPMEHLDAITSAREKVIAWQQANPTLVKDPD